MRGEVKVSLFISSINHSAILRGKVKVSLCFCQTNHSVFVFGPSQIFTDDNKEIIVLFLRDIVKVSQ